MGASTSKHQDVLDSNATTSSSSNNEDSLSKNPSSPTNNDESSSKCPMKLGNSKSTTNASGGGCPMKQKTSSSTASSKQKIQYNVYSQPIDPKNNMPTVANQLPSAGQTDELSVERKKSTIPKGGTDNETWVYPSPQMFYNALTRKQKLDDTKESDIPSVVALHNNMNEKTWAKILEWESVLDSNINNNISSTSSTSQIKTPKLLRFLGRPSDLSPKAKFKNLFLSHPLPFDRHDWTIVRPDGTEVRYIIDYYHDESRASELPDSGLPDMEDREAVKSILVDVRPALDSVYELKGRCFTMPMARYMGETKFEPLPMKPTEEMIGQVDESLKVWDNIQKQAKINSAIQQNKQADDNKIKSEKITSEEAVEIAKSFANILKQCSESKKIMESCEKDEEYAQASLALSMCMAKIICPLQHKTVVKTLHSEDKEENSEVHDAKVDASLENMLMCVAEGNERVSRAKVEFPDLFQDKN